MSENYKETSRKGKLENPWAAEQGRGGPEQQAPGEPRERGGFARLGPRACVCVGGLNGNLCAPQGCPDLMRTGATPPVGMCARPGGVRRCVAVRCGGAPGQTSFRYPELVSPFRRHPPAGRSFSAV